MNASVTLLKALLLGLEGEAADLGERVGQLAAAEERIAGILGAPVGGEYFADQARSRLVYSMPCSPAASMPSTSA